MLAREDFACYTSDSRDYYCRVHIGQETVGCGAGSEDHMNFNTEDAGGSLKKETDRSKEQPMQMICSGILRKDGEKIIYVRFERGADFAEGSLPAAKITSQSGFSPDEISQFESYMSENRFSIIEQAKTVNLMKNFMR